MGYDYKKGPAPDNVPPDVQKIWDKLIEKDVYVPPKSSPPAPHIIVVFNPPVKPNPYIPPSPPNSTFPLQAHDHYPPPPPEESWFDKQMPKDVPLWCFVALSCLGGLIGLVSAHGKGTAVSIIYGLGGAGFGLFAIPLVALAWALAWRAAILAVIFYVGYVLLVHMMK
jgi:hypothetical protein